MIVPSAMSLNNSLFCLPFLSTYSWLNQCVEMSLAWNVWCLICNLGCNTESTLSRQRGMRCNQIKISRRAPGKPLMAFTKSFYFPDKTSRALSSEHQKHVTRIGFSAIRMLLQIRGCKRFDTSNIFSSQTMFWDWSSCNREDYWDQHLQLGMHTDRDRPRKNITNRWI